ncbi:MAG: Pseudouridine kinase [Eubacteriales bacterium SKADARSKE-1]|nr:Pseudouridine kinase [Eubacteriales bacterium SKADARSKE-1]
MSIGKYICVVGGANIDITACPMENPLPHDSTPGKVTWGLGGVGRNISENLTALNQGVEFITVFGTDYYSQKIKKDCNDKNIKLNYNSDVITGDTPTYVCLNDKFGEMLYAVSDMSIYDNITPEFLRERIDIINNSKACVFDTNIPEESIKYLTNNCCVPLFAETVSTNKAKKLKRHLGKIYAIKPNLLEAEVLSGIKIKDRKTLDSAAAVLLSGGLKSIFISLGKDGTYYANEQESGIVPCFKIPVINTTGAGDSFMAGLIFSFIKNGANIKMMALHGTAAAALTVSSKFSVSENMSCQNIENILSL